MNNNIPTYLGLCMIDCAEGYIKMSYSVIDIQSLEATQ